jgi:uncharacterized protein (TIGR03067 family)
MATRRAVIASSIVLVSLFAVAARSDEPKLEGDLKTLQGEWTSKDEQGNVSGTWVFKGDKLSLKAEPGREYKITVKLDEKAKPDKTIELDVAEDSPNSKGFKGPGIYKFDGEKKVTICFGADGNRPTEYKTNGETQFSFDLVKK